MASSSRKRRRRAAQEALKETIRQAKKDGTYRSDDPDYDPVVANPHRHPHLRGYGAEADHARRLAGMPSQKNPALSHLEQTFSESGAMVLVNDNQFGPAFPGDIEWSWVLCYGCGVPFQYWGGFFATSEPESPLPNEVIEGIAAGPCPNCGGAGVPMIMHLVKTTDGRSAALSTFTVLRDIEVLMADLRGGKIDVDEAAFRLREKGGVFRKIGDWMETRPVTTAAVLAILTVLHQDLSSGEAQARDERKEEQLGEMMETVLDHYDEVHNHPPTRSRQPKASTKKGKPSTGQGSSR